MANRWKHYDPQWGEYEYNQPPAFPWNRAYREETPRYILGEDGYWHDPQAADSATALLSCAGDLMCEPRMTEAYRYGNAYFFHPLFQYVRDIFRSSDFAVANLETTLTDSSAYAGDYHCIGGKYHCNGRFVTVTVTPARMCPTPPTNCGIPILLPPTPEKCTCWVACSPCECPRPRTSWI